MKTLTNEVKAALAIALEMHQGQKDKAGADYILHPLTVALTVAANGYGERAISAALLHDVVEDTEMTFERLAELGISEEVVDALRLLTHAKGTDYFDYVRAVKNNPIAKAVKLADLAHNMDLSRLNQITDADMKRVEKYRKAVKMLTDQTPSQCDADTQLD